MSKEWDGSDLIKIIDKRIKNLKFKLAFSNTESLKAQILGMLDILDWVKKEIKMLDEED